MRRGAWSNRSRMAAPKVANAGAHPSRGQHLEWLPPRLVHGAILVVDPLPGNAVLSAQLTKQVSQYAGGRTLPTRSDRGLVRQRSSSS